MFRRLAAINSLGSSLEEHGKLIWSMRRAHRTPAHEVDNWMGGAPHLPISEITQTRFRTTAAWQHCRSARLYHAAQRGELTNVNQLLSEGTDTDWLEPELGITALHVATMHGRAACVLSLLRAGADIHEQGEHGCTPLDLFGFGASWFGVADRMCPSCDYQACHRLLLMAHAASEARSKYQGFVVLHPGGEVGLVRDKVGGERDRVRAQIDYQSIYRSTWKSAWRPPRRPALLRGGINEYGVWQPS